MRTKLVYVLTCAPEATYIEQALISIYSARVHNPDAHIVLIVDDKTNELLAGKRAEVLEYVTEKLVVSFNSDASMHYRSRWLKSQVRELIVGDLLFIDCDTVCNTSLEEIDNLDAMLAMVPDEHLPLRDYPDSVKLPLVECCDKLGYNILEEEFYYNSGVIYAKDCSEVKRLWKCWHECWVEGEKKGVKPDQPSLGKANILCDHIIQRLPDTWNTLIYMNPIFANEGKILHFWNFRNKSFIFARPFLKYIKKNGLTLYAKDCILIPLKSVLPFNNVLTQCNIFQYLKFAKQIRQQRKLYALNVDASFSDFPWSQNYSLLRIYISIKLLGKKENRRVFFS